jgi:hypothetical protein
MQFEAGLRRWNLDCEYLVTAALDEEFGEFAFLARAGSEEKA